MDFSYINDPGWQDLTPEKQQEVISYVFKQDIESDPDWANLDADKQQEVTQFYHDQAHETSLLAQQTQEQNQKEAIPDRGIGGFLKDTAIDLGKSIVNTGQAAVGLLDMATFNLAGDALAFVGYDSEKTNEFLSSGYSEARQESNKEVSEATGFWGTVGALVDNPDVAFGSIIESSLMSLGSAGVARSVATKMLGTALATEGITAGSAAAKAFATKFFTNKKVIASITAAGASAEGLFSAGQTQEQARATGISYYKSILPSIGTGLGTAGIGILSSKIPGFQDAEAQLATSGLGAIKKKFKDSLGNIVKTSFKEGVLEEAPQSAWEQGMSNVIYDKSFTAGMPEASAHGMIVGMGQGGGMAVGSNILNKPTVKTDPTEPSPDLVGAPDRDGAVAAAEEEMAAILAAAGKSVTPEESVPTSTPVDEAALQEDQLDTITPKSSPDPVVIPRPIASPVEESEGLILPQPGEPTDEVPIIPVEQKEPLVEPPKEVTTPAKLETPVEPTKAKPVEVTTAEEIKLTPKEYAEIAVKEAKFSIQETIKLNQQLKENNAKQKLLDPGPELTQLRIEEGEILEQIDAHKPIAPSVEPELSRKPIATEPITPPADRRTNLDLRKRIEDMTLEEAQVALKTDELTGLGNRRAYDEATKKPIQSSIDVDSLKTINDEFGHSAGDDLLSLVGEALQQTNLDAFRISGDEYVAQGNTEQEVMDNIEVARTYLDENPLVLVDNNGDIIAEVKGTFSYGTGKTYKEADTELAKDKAEREATGDRAARGEEPKGIKRFTSGMQVNAEERLSSKEKGEIENLIQSRIESLGQVKEPTEKDRLMLKKVSAWKKAITEGTATDKKLQTWKAETLADVLRAQKEQPKVKAKPDEKPAKPAKQLQAGVYVPGEGVSLKDIQEQFPEQQVFLNEAKEVSVVFKNGQGLKITQVKDFENGDKEIAMESGQMDEHGIILGMTEHNKITLNKDLANAETLAHEMTHGLKNLGILTAKDEQTLFLELNKLDQAGKFHYDRSTMKNKTAARDEDLANVLAQVLTGRKAYRDTTIGKIIQKVMDFVDSLMSFGKQTTRKLAAEIESGKIFGREATEKQSFDGQASIMQPAPLWYSALVKGVEGIKQEVAPAAQWKAMVKKLPIKKEELDWTGVNDWLDEQPGKVKKQDLIDFIAANNVMLEEVILSSEETILEEREKLAKTIWNNNKHPFWETSDMDKYDYIVEEGGEEFYAFENFKRIPFFRDQSKETHHSKWQEPGGKDYKELLLTIPPKTVKTDSFKLGGKVVGQTEEADTYKSTHFDEPNIIAHVRFNERTDAEGNSVLFLEEVQSDWHQAGRKEGYAVDQGKELKDFAKEHNIKLRFNSDGSLPVREQVQLREAAKETIGTREINRLITNTQNTGFIPDAPFKKSWPLLILKRMVRYAAENGFDKIAWTTGEQQAARYDLSKQVDRIEYEHLYDATGERGWYYSISVMDKNENEIYGSGNASAKELENVVGKEIVQKMEAGEGKKNDISDDRVLSGLDLKVGGEGMKAFYDKMLPSAAKKFFKKFGGRIEETKINTGNDWVSGQDVMRDLNIPESESSDYWRNLSQDERDQMMDQYRNKYNNIPVNSMTITPQMKVSAVREGMPMFTTSDNQAKSPFEVNPTSTRTETGEYNFIDILAPISKTQKAIKKELPPEQDYLTQERLRRNQTGHTVKQAQKELIQPITDIMVKNNYTTDDIDEAKLGQHAPEANKRLKRTNAKRFLLALADTHEKDYLKAEIDAIDEAMQSKEIKELELPNSVTQDQYLELLRKELAYTVSKDTKKIKADWLDRSSRFAGVTNKQAKELSLKWANEDGMQEILKLTDKLTAATLKISLDSGRITQDEYDAFKGAYKHYAPLQREGHDVKSGLFGSSQGIVKLGKDYKIRGGSKSRPVNLFVNMIAQHERAINNAALTEAGETFLNLAKENPNPDFWKISKKTMVNAYDAHGNIYKKDDYKIESNDIPLKLRGKYYIISMEKSNEHAMRIARHLKGDDINTGPIVRGLQSYNKVLSAVYTGLSPAFLMKNLPRDIQIAMINLNSTELKDMQAKVFKTIPSAFMGMRDYMRGDGTSKMGKYAAEAAKAGMLMSWSNQGHDIVELGKNINKEVRLQQKNLKATTLRTGKKIFQLIMDYNTIAENATRLAAYTWARTPVAEGGAGMSKAKSALLGKELTVNFEQKGLYGEVINSFYMFSNPGIQGTVRMIHSLRTSPKAFKQVLGLITASAGVVLANSFMGGDDDEGKNKYQQVQSYDKERNMIFVVPELDHPIKLPLGWGLNFFWNIGTELGEAFVASQDSDFKYSPMEGASRLLFNGLNAFNPIQAATIAQMASPSIADPWVQIWENKNFYGAPLMPEKNKFAAVPKPNSQRYWSSVRPTSKAFAEWLNGVTKGDKVEKGLIDISPEHMDLVFDTFTGGMGKFIEGVVKLPAVLKEDKVDVKKIPLVQEFFGTYNKDKGRQSYYDNTKEIKTLLKKIKIYPERRRELQKDPRFRLKDYLKSTERQINALRKILKKARTEKSKQRLNDRIKKLQNKFNERFEERINK